MVFERAAMDQQLTFVVGSDVKALPSEMVVVKNTARGVVETRPEAGERAILAIDVYEV